MALPTTTPSDSPRLDSLSPATAYCSKDNIFAPKQAQAEGVAVIADARLEDSDDHTVASVTAPPSE